MSLKITKGEATPSSITLFFSDALFHAEPTGSTTDYSAKNKNNYKITEPGSSALFTVETADYNAFFRAVVLSFSFTPSRKLKVGEWLFVTVSGIAVASDSGTDATGGGISVAVQVNGEHEVKDATRAVEEAVAYPVLTEQVDFSQSGGIPTTGGGFQSPQGAASLGLVASSALSDVLGWKVNSSDSRGFVGALTQSFTLTEVEGHTEATYTPRSYTVQTDLSQGITGAQASLYTRAKDALDKCLPLLDGLYTLDPDVEPEDANALRVLARSQMTEIVKELGQVGGPSILRVDTYFHILLGVPLNSVITEVPTDADDLNSGTLKDLREVFGIGFDGNPFSNTVTDEEDITNFRTIVDYMTSLLQTWINNRRFFDLSSTSEAFFGTQLVLISRQLSVIVETVNEVRFAMNSVFIGPSERQTLLLKFNDFQPMFVEDILVEIDQFASDEGPRLVQDGGRLAVHNNVLPVVRSLSALVKEARKPTNIRDLPDGFRTARVQNTLGDLHDQLQELVRLAKPVGRKLPPTEGGVFAIPAALNFSADKPPAANSTKQPPPPAPPPAPPPQHLTIVNLGNTDKSVTISVVDDPTSSIFTVDRPKLLLRAQKSEFVAIIPRASFSSNQQHTLEIQSAGGVVLQTVLITVS